MPNPVYYLRNISVLNPIVIDNNAGGDIIVQTALTYQTIKLYRLLIICAGATNVKIKDGGVELSGPLPFQAGGGIILDMQNDPWYLFYNNFIINSSAAVQISGTAWTVQSG